MGKRLTAVATDDTAKTAPAWTRDFRCLAFSPVFAFFSPSPIRVAQHLHGVANANARIRFREVRAQLRHAANVAGCHRRGTRGTDRLRLLRAQRMSDGRLVEIVGTGAATTQMGVGNLPQIDAGNSPQER